MIQNRNRQDTGMLQGTSPIVEPSRPQNLFEYIISVFFSEMLKVGQRVELVCRVVRGLGPRVAEEAAVGKVDAPLARHPKALPGVIGSALRRFSLIGPC
jgi:hypothetical protein